MHHDFDPKWKTSMPDCEKNGLMSYFDPKEDEEKIDSFQGQKWADVWTYCNIEDLKKWWNFNAKRCLMPLNHIDFSDRLQGTYFLFLTNIFTAD